MAGAGVELCVKALGAPEAPGLLLAHGVGSSARYLREAFAVPVCAAGWRLVVYDLRGHGASTRVTDPAGHALDRHVADLDAVAAATGAEVVGGVSLGGHVATAWAARGGRPRAVVACLPAWTGRAVPGDGPHAAMAAEVAEVGVDGMLARLRADTSVPAWLRATLLEDWPSHDRASLEAALISLDGGLAPTAAELQALPCPLGVVGWQGDPGHPAAVAHEWVMHAPHAALRATTVTAPDRDPHALGHLLVDVLAALGAAPADRTSGPPHGAGVDHPEPSR